MKKSILFLITGMIMLANMKSFAQSKNLFYATIEDYKNKKPLPNCEIPENAYRSVNGSVSFLVKKAGTEERIKMANLPAPFFLYNDQLVRVVGKHGYIVIVNGSPWCYYAKFGANQVQMVSQGINGELSKFKEKSLKKLLKENGLYEAFKKDYPKREFKDNVNAYFNKRVAHYKKYYELLNQALNKK